MGSCFLHFPPPPELLVNSAQLYFCRYRSVPLPGVEQVLFAESWPRPPEQRQLGCNRTWHVFPTHFPTICLIPQSGAGPVCVCVSVYAFARVCPYMHAGTASSVDSSLLQGGSPSEIIRYASSMVLWILLCPSIGWELLMIAMVINLSPENQPETIKLILCRPLGNAENLGENCIFVWKESLWTPGTGFNWTV